MSKMFLSVFALALLVAGCKQNTADDVEPEVVPPAAETWYLTGATGTVYDETGKIESRDSSLVLYNPDKTFKTFINYSSNDTESYYSLTQFVYENGKVTKTLISGEKDNAPEPSEQFLYSGNHAVIIKRVDGFSYDSLVYSNNQLIKLMTISTTGQD